MAAAGAAFYATLALFPAISTLISLYGLAFGRASVAPQLRFLEGLLPAPAYALIAGRVGAHVAAPVHLAGLGMLGDSSLPRSPCRTGSARHGGTARRVGWPGVAVATVLWLAASGALSFYAAHLPSFGATYGSRGAVVGIMLWFYLSVHAVLVGAEVNAVVGQADPRRDEDR